MSLRARKPKRTPVWKKLLGGVFYALVCFVALMLGAGAQWVGRSGVMSEAFRQTIFNESADEVFNKDSITLLILGCDEDRAYGGKQILREYARSDMMLVAKIDFAKKRVGGVSIPRDLEIAVPGYRSQKINAYHSIGGKDLAKQAAEQVVGIPIDRVIVINYEAFQHMVDSVGGVEVYVEKKMIYHDDRGGLHIDLKPGRQRLSGYQAMGFVRFRHDAGSDITRQQRQKDFLLAFKDAVNKNRSKFPEVTNRAEEVLNGALSSREVAALGMYLRGIPSDNIKMGQVPVLQGRGYNLDLDHNRLPEVLAAHYLIEAPVGYSGRISRR
jgi:LCP family protein required for cell wall assembly